MKRLALLALLLAACTPSVVPRATDVVLHGTDGSRIAVSIALRAHPYTVVTFFSIHCPCQRAHDERLRALMAKEEPRGVGFLVVDSEESATAADDARESKERGYPIVRDEDGALARALDAEYATYSVVMDAKGAVLYRGGFDSDKSHLRKEHVTYLENAVEDLLAGRAVARAEAKTLGCTLEIR